MITSLSGFISQTLVGSFSLSLKAASNLVITHSELSLRFISNTDSTNIKSPH